MKDVYEHVKSGAGKLQPSGLDTYDLRMVCTFLDGWKENKQKIMFHDKKIR